MRAFYNEIDPKVAHWLSDLSERWLISPGKICTDSIEDLKPRDLVPYERCHFFAGIGGWEYALQLAGWPKNLDVWTGSCPCQSFSTSGQRKGFNDERHLWPAWFWLIQQCRPNIIFGEQVASKQAQGWLDLVFTDLESENYTCGASVLGAHSAGAPHIRQRIYWVAYTHSNRWRQRIRDKLLGEQNKTIGMHEANESHHRGNWHCHDVEWRPTPDEKYRPIEPGIKPMAHGIPNRVVRNTAYGNAIVPQTASMFIRATMDALVKDEPIISALSPN